MSLVLPSSRGKHFLVNLFDTPGHVNFSDEACASMRACDGVVLVVDCVEGVMIQTERLLKYAVQEGISVVVMLNKIDRLIVELKLPPADAYLKLKHTLEEINGIIGKPELKVSPLLGNVIFGSGYYNFMFTLKSYAERYAQQYSIDPITFEKILYTIINTVVGETFTMTLQSENSKNNKPEPPSKEPLLSLFWSLYTK